VARPLSELLPTTHAFAAGRAMVDGGPMPWGELGLAAVGTLVATLAALAFLAWMLRLFRRRGYVTRYSYYKSPPKSPVRNPWGEPWWVVVGYGSPMSLLPPASRSFWPATAGRGVRSHRWLLPLALMLATLVASLTLGRALWPGAAVPRVVRGTVTAVGADRTAIGFMPHGHRDPDPPPSLRERLTDWRYGFRNSFTGYEVGGAPWADADGAWNSGTVPACLIPPGTIGQRVELGLVRVRPGADGRPGGVVVVWLRCL
jgi:hypothetical protein